MHAEICMLPLTQCGILCDYLYKFCSGCIVLNNPDLYSSCIPSALLYAAVLVHEMW